MMMEIIHFAVQVDRILLAPDVFRSTNFVTLDMTAIKYSIATAISVQSFYKATN